jgi:hypothetical protein
MAKRTIKDMKGWPGTGNPEGAMTSPLGGSRGGGYNKSHWKKKRGMFSKMWDDLFGSKKGKKGKKLKGENVREVQTKPSKALGDQKSTKIKRRKEESIPIREKGEMRKKKERMEKEGRAHRKTRNKSLYGDW